MSENKTIRKRFSFGIDNCTRESLEKYKSNEWIDSEIFNVAIGENITKWLLRICPNGERHEDRSNISFFLMCKGSSSTDFNAQCQLGIWGDANKEHYITEMVSGEDLAKYGYGFPEFISHDLLFGEKQSLINEGKIKFYCDLSLQLSTQHYKKMFDNEYLTDFQLKTNDGETLKVHKSILAARSPVFYAMLKQDMKEANEGVAEVPDFDSTVIKELLRFVYYNKVENLPAVAHQLVYAANKYQVEDLRDDCVDEIIDSITTENVLESLVISERVTGSWRAEDLFTECLDIIAVNIETVSSSKEWKHLPNDIVLKMVHHLSLQNEQVLSTSSF